MIHTNIILKQALWRTEIEGNDVETNSIGIIVVWKNWIDHLVSFIYDIPDFRFLITEKKINYQTMIMKVNLPAVNHRTSTNDHYVIF